MNQTPPQPNQAPSVPVEAVSAASAGRKRPYRHGRAYCIRQALYWLRKAITR